MSKLNKTKDTSQNNTFPRKVVWKGATTRLGLDLRADQWIQHAIDNGWITIPSDALDITEITYTELMTHISNSTLLPSSMYLITDFRSRHTILGTAVVVNPAIEPLIVLATSANSISRKVWSTVYPQDEIIWEPETNIDGSMSYGFISYRKDTERNISAYYDWRTVLIRRYETSVGSGIYVQPFDPGGGEDFEDVLTFHNLDVRAIHNVELPVINEDIRTMYAAVLGGPVWNNLTVLKFPTQPGGNNFPEGNIRFHHSLLASHFDFSGDGSLVPEVARFNNIEFHDSVLLTFYYYNPAIADPSRPANLFENCEFRGRNFQNRFSNVLFSDVRAEANFLTITGTNVTLDHTRFMTNVGLDPGQTVTWENFYSYVSEHGAMTDGVSIVNVGVNNSEIHDWGGTQLRDMDITASYIQLNNCNNTAATDPNRSSINRVYNVVFDGSYFENARFTNITGTSFYTGGSFTHCIVATTTFGQTMTNFVVAGESDANKVRIERCKFTPFTTSTSITSSGGNTTNLLNVNFYTDTRAQLTITNASILNCDFHALANTWEWSSTGNTLQFNEIWAELSDNPTAPELQATTTVKVLTDDTGTATGVYWDNATGDWLSFTAGL